MEGILNVQLDLHQSIKRGFTNYKKSPKDRITLEYIEARLENLETVWDSFKKNHARLYEISLMSDLLKTGYVNKEIYDETEESYISYKASLKVDVKKYSPSQEKESKSKDINVSNGASSVVRLPKITIPTFSGNYLEWTTFRDLFVSLVHNNGTLDNVQKLHYLKTHLTGEAAQLVKHMPITDTNYAECWLLLNQRYNNKKYLANCILKRLFGQKRLAIESASGMKEMIDTTMDCMSALKNIGVEVTTWDVIVIHIVTFKLDLETRKQWELHTSNDVNELPTLQQFKEFMECRFRALEFIDTRKSLGPPSSSKTKAFLATDTSLRCEFCAESHKLCFCKKFAQQTCTQRRDFVTENSICYNCLGSNHSVNNCRCPTNCKICKKRHHSLLHEIGNSRVTPSATERNSMEGTSSSTSATPIVSCMSTQRIARVGSVLLATALVKIETSMTSSNQQVVRALVDQGSEACFITEAAVQLLRLKKIPAKGTITGLGGNQPVIAKSVVTLNLKSLKDPNFHLQVEAYVLKNITSYLPEQDISTEAIDWIGHDLILADPQFALSNKVDLLLGANVYSKILLEGIKRSPAGGLIAQNTLLGWILSGTVENNSEKVSSFNIKVMHTQIKEDDALKRFWEIEEQAKDAKKLWTEEEQKCEDIFLRTTKRTKEGIYIVKLPFRDNEPQCIGGNSRQIAVAKFKSLEKRLEKDEELQNEYKKVIKEYLELGHMRLIEDKGEERNNAVYLPHHAVVRKDKTTSKVRVVFNASSKNNFQVSLNDTLMIGPKLQADLRHLVLRWRLHPIALVADIVKMYRMVRIAEEDAVYQRIVWRDQPEKEIQDYELMTVTFGTSSAPFLAVRALHQVSIDEGVEFPLAAPKVVQSFYMDDLMTGCSNVQEGVNIYKQITELLEKGGFTLQKWNSNNLELLSEINKDMGKQDKRDKENKKDNTGIQDNQEGKINKGDIGINQSSNKDKLQKYNLPVKEDNYLRKEQNKQEKDNLYNQREKEVQQEKENLKDKRDIEIKDENTTKILGLTWDRSEDQFQYTVNLPSATTEPETKRSIISLIAKLYDPLGWIAPTIIQAKIFIQKLWLSGTNWDEPVSSELRKEWSTYHNQLSNLTAVRVPRWLSTSGNDVLMELHGFSDASKLAYAAVVYLRVVDSTGNTRVSLVTARTRVAPIKQVSIPRLELCGAVLLSQLLTEVAEVLDIQKKDIRAWTDSTVVLAWLNSHPSKWKTFVANRTSAILTTLESSQWYHITSKLNPADCASRGIEPESLATNELWFKGPSFLREQSISYKRLTNLKVNLEEAVSAHVTSVMEDNIIERFSSLQRLLRVVAYCRRFYKREIIQTNYLTRKELDKAMIICVKIVQKEEFNTEYLQLQSKRELKCKTSRLRALCPYLDEEGMMRVSGRLQKSQLPAGTKHPIILPHSSHLTKLVVAHAHHITLHGGIQLMVNYLRATYWIIGVKNLVKHHIRKCVTCVRQRATFKTPLMGSLPSVRCTPAKAFLNSGVDYAGPIKIRTSKGRGNRSYKGYICIFVCMVTRAVHLEVVSDMTSQAFLAAFRRFVSRRGHCAQLWSDNGTTFVGAARELKELRAIQNNVASILENQGTEFHFIPPHSPNWGGLWEAAVKSTKFHLRRVIGEATLTFEEISTLLTQVEACLNSRPMTVDNSDPGEPLPLTPGHFLIGGPLLGIPEVNYLESSINSLSRWQLIQRMLQGFWRRWSQEYLSKLMNRYKWSHHTPEPNVGDVVLIKEDDLPPTRWLMGRIVEKHPGTDNITRVVTIRVKNTTIKRPVSKLCVLPVHE